MICLNITNCSEVVASKVGNLLEKLTPDVIDQTIVEKKIVERILESLCQEGLQGDISIVKGMEISQEKITLRSGVTVIEKQKF